MQVDPNNPKSPFAAIAGTIRNAAKATGASFDHLLATAKAESALNPKASAPTSSARGLFQFIEQTWLAMVKEAGPALGYSGLSDQVTKTDNGYVVADADARAKILDLRDDPSTNATLAGAFTQRNAAEVADRIGRQPTDAELYIAHFLGSGGAAKLINLAAQQPQASAAEAFPGAARANRSIFYDRDGGERTAAGVYGNLASRYQAARTSTTALAQGTPPATVPVAAPLAIEEPRPARLASDGPLFHSLVQTEERRGGVAPVVAALWNSPDVAQKSFDMRGLFSDQPTDVRGLFAPKS